MKLKRYLQFIKESLKEDLDSGELYELNEYQIREYLIELSDAGYLITVNFGFVEKNTSKNSKGFYWTPSLLTIIKEVYTENIVAGQEIRPAYWIEIKKSRDVNNEDVTDSLKFACSIIEDEGDCDIKLHDADTDVDINTTLIKGGIFINVDSEDNMSGEEAEDYIAIFAKQKKTIKITPKDLVDYYGWKVEVQKEDQLCAEIDLEDLSDFILSPTRADYKSFLVKGIEHMWDYYNISDYYPDINSLFQSLDKENKVLVVKSIIKELGGLKNTIGYIGDECDDDIYEIVKVMTKEEELIEYLLNERFYVTIEQLGSNSKILSGILESVANWEMSAHCDDNYDEIVSAFDSIVSDELGQFEKVKKDDITYYQFPYNNDWISDIESEYLYNRDIDDIFRDWIREQNIGGNLNPRISDYGDVNKEDMNKDIESFLKRYLFDEK